MDGLNDKFENRKKNRLQTKILRFVVKSMIFLLVQNDIFGRFGR